MNDDRAQLKGRCQSRLGVLQSCNDRRASQSSRSSLCPTWCSRSCTRHCTLRITAADLRLLHPLFSNWPISNGRPSVRCCRSASGSCGRCTETGASVLQASPYLLLCSVRGSGPISVQPLNAPVYTELLRRVRYHPHASSCETLRQDDGIRITLFTNIPVV